MISAIGQDSHRFTAYTDKKPLILGGVRFAEPLTLEANSDGDVVLHAITNAVSGVTCVNILGEPADELCRSGVTDSSVYLKKALESLMGRITHLSVSIECRTPHFSQKIPQMRESIAGILRISPAAVGITATSGEGLTACGRGEGISVLCILSVEEV